MVLVRASLEAEAGEAEETSSPEAKRAGRHRRRRRRRELGRETLARSPCRRRPCSAMSLPVPPPRPTTSRALLSRPHSSKGLEDAPSLVSRPSREELARFKRPLGGGEGAGKCGRRRRTTPGLGKSNNQMGVVRSLARRARRGSLSFVSRSSPLAVSGRCKGRRACSRILSVSVPSSRRRSRERVSFFFLSHATNKRGEKNERQLDPRKTKKLQTPSALQSAPIFSNRARALILLFPFPE